MLSIMRFRKQLRGASDQSSGLDTDSAFSDDASSMLSGSESSTSSASVNGQSQLPPQTTNVRFLSLLQDNIAKEKEEYLLIHLLGLANLHRPAFEGYADCWTEDW